MRNQRVGPADPLIASPCIVSAMHARAIMHETEMEMLMQQYRDEAAIALMSLLVGLATFVAIGALISGVVA